MYINAKIYQLHNLITNVYQCQNQIFTLKKKKKLNFNKHFVTLFASVKAKK